MSSARTVLLVNVVLTVLLLLLIEAGFRLVEPAKHLSQKEFRMQRPEPYANSEYFSPDFIEESFSQPGGWVTPEGTRIVLPNNYHGKWFNVEENLRVTVKQPKQYSSRVLLFGGSTVYNSEVPDRYTIASLLQEQLNREGYLTRVENYGVTTVHSAQQLERLKRDVRLSRSDVVVFFDGVNDVYQRLYRKNPDGTMFDDYRKTPILVRLIRKARSHSAFLRWIDERMIAPREFSLSDELVAAESTEYASVIGRANEHVVSGQARFYHFLQPNLFTRHRRNHYEESLLDSGGDIVPRGIREAFERGYPVMRQALRAHTYSQDLSQIYDSMETSPYLDFCHVNEQANQRVAMAILERVRESLEK